MDGPNRWTNPSLAQDEFTNLMRRGRPIAPIPPGDAVCHDRAYEDATNAMIERLRRVARAVRAQRAYAGGDATAMAETGSPWQALDALEDGDLGGG